MSSFSPAAGHSSTTRPIVQVYERLAEIIRRVKACQ
jgi:hypothetical protein